MLKVNLTPRLEMIISLVPKSRCVCDIGTDHGYVAIELVRRGLAKKVIAADINKGPLMSAQKNIRLYGSENVIETRLSDGFKNISQNEADCAVIAGMGGETIASILKEEKGSSHFVLQPQTGHGELRKYLCENGFVIKKEAIAQEGKKMYTAIYAVRGDSYSLSKTELEIGPYLIKNRPPLFDSYVRYRLYEIDSILKKLSCVVAEERRMELLEIKKEYENLI